jgi:hypothetical protein
MSAKQTYTFYNSKFIYSWHELHSNEYDSSSFLSFFFVIRPEKKDKINRIFIFFIYIRKRQCHEKLHKTDDKGRRTYVKNNMEQKNPKLNLTSIIHRDDAQPWDDFVINTDGSTTVEKDTK